MDDEAAPQAARGAADGGRAGTDLAAVSEALGVLRLAWGDGYMFGYDELGYWAARPGRPGTAIHRADDPEELGRLLSGDAGRGAS